MHSKYLPLLLVLAKESFSVPLINHVQPNPSSFKPFVTTPKDTFSGASPNNLAPVTLSGTFACVSAAASLFIAGPFGAVAAGALEGVAVYFGTKAKALSPADIYQQIFGSIQEQINQALNSQRTSTLTSRLATLSSNVNDEMVTYLSLLGISRNANETLKQMKSGSVPIPSVIASQVDLHMKSVDSILSSSPDWFSFTGQLDMKSAFALVNVVGNNPKWCLHTENHNVAAGSLVVVSDDCDLNSPDDKMFVVEEGSDRILLRGSTGDYCMAYHSESGTGFENNAVAIYPFSHAQCTQKTAVITVKQSASDESWSLFDGKNQLCLDKTGKIFSPVTFQVNVPDFSGEGIGNSEADDNNPCQTKQWSFASTIPFILNNNTAGGASAQTVAPPYSFDEIGVKLYYFATLAAYHLISLKEMYLHGQDQDSAATQYNKKIKEYKEFLSMHIPVFEAYANFTLLDAKRQNKDAKDFLKHLEKATLNSGISVIDI